MQAYDLPTDIIKFARHVTLIGSAQAYLHTLLHYIARIVSKYYIVEFAQRMLLLVVTFVQRIVLLTVFRDYIIRGKGDTINQTPFDNHRNSSRFIMCLASFHIGCGLRR